MLTRPLPLKLIIVAVASLTTIGAMVVSMWIVADASTKSLAKQIGRTMAVVAHDVLDRVDFTMHERYEDLASLAALAAERPVLHPSDAKSLVEQAHRLNSSFESFALLTPGMELLAASGDVEHIEDFLRSQGPEPASTDGPKGTPTFHMLPPAKSGGSGTTAKSRTAISIRVTDHAGELKTIAVAVLDWDFAQSIFSAVKHNYLDDSDAEIIILSDLQNVLAASSQPAHELASFPFNPATFPGKTGSFIDTGSDGIAYVTGVSKSGPDRIFANLSFTVFVRQTVANAHSVLNDLQRTIIVCALLTTLLAVLLHWRVATVLSAPLLRLSAAADGLRQGKAAAIPRLEQYEEVRTLSNSLISLVGELNARAASLAELSASLELQVRDRTQALERRNLELSEAKQLADSAIVAKNRLLAVASHDLRQPLHALRLFTNSLSRRVSDEEAVRLVLRQEQSLVSLTQILDELLHIARLDAGLVERNMVPVDLREIIDRVGAEFSFEADDRGLRFNVMSVDCHVKTDPALIETIVRNLLSNAFKFTRTGGILLGCRRRGSSATIEVYDTGCGIEPSRLAAVFQEFERSPVAAIGPNKGLGLGLSIVERHVALIGGTVHVLSKPGRGTSFRITLPQVVAGPATAEIAPEPSARPIAGMTLLLLDDNVDVLDALRMELTDRGAVVSAFVDPDEAGAAIAGGAEPDVVIIDYDLGTKLTAIDVLSRWRNIGRFGHALILTGQTDTQTLARVADNGIPWLPKPTAPQTLADAIGQLAAREPKSVRRPLTVLEWDAS